MELTHQLTPMLRTCDRINLVVQALDDPHTAARGMVQTVEHPSVGALRVLGMPFTLSGTPATKVAADPRPAHGRHPARRAGLSDQRIAELRAGRVI